MWSWNICSSPNSWHQSYGIWCKVNANLDTVWNTSFRNSVVLGVFCVISTFCITGVPQNAELSQKIPIYRIGSYAAIDNLFLNQQLIGWWFVCSSRDRGLQICVKIATVPACHVINLSKMHIMNGGQNVIFGCEISQKYFTSYFHILQYHCSAQCGMNTTFFKP